ncbi:hypothetical protein EYZ11_009427 [Aspergillus tanneri]|uniref:Uncharacterized protein n=1 Tax=Aspergillus tanneri TaxID=1220188 RepID=A0A4S3J7X6_9EURO|nr:uncharacterized protein ATNIH1004_000020 [Aspergillus tanneri]KAA8651142.1 hypothetical protein ATNIH1004_000020 [Aspergillus tanneri]THC91113.1 hypothetical protein EYZ11_009427 [Aspergillus tanneri]
MKPTAFIYSLLAASVTAVPLETQPPKQVTVALSNDQSGAYAGVAFAADGTDRGIPALYKGTPVDKEGNILASSAQLTAFPQTIKCVIKNNGVPIATLTAQNTYANLNPKSGPVPVNLNNGVINCIA